MKKLILIMLVLCATSWAGGMDSTIYKTQDRTFAIEVFYVDTVGFVIDSISIWQGVPYYNSHTATPGDRFVPEWEHRYELKAITEKHIVFTYYPDNWTKSERWQMHKVRSVPSALDTLSNAVWLEKGKQDLDELKHCK